jgi:hypothetical protein
MLTQKQLVVKSITSAYQGHSWVTLFVDIQNIDENFLLAPQKRGQGK